MGEDAIQIGPEELRTKLQSAAPPQLIDVRWPQEHQICRIEGARLIPLDRLPASLGELDPEAELVVYCHHGMRSLNAVQFLRAQGFANARSLSGGIDLWSQRIDPAVPRY